MSEAQQSASVESSSSSGTAYATALAPNPATSLEAREKQNPIDWESFLGSDHKTFNASITSSIRQYREENGRRYHSFREGSYPIPNDETEQERLDLAHHVYCAMTGNRLFLAPLKDPKRVLDLGTGTGIWAMDFADEFPNAEVIGTDLSPIQPDWVPPNLKFAVDDFEDTWVYDPGISFDFIHARCLGASVRNLDYLYEQVYKHLSPGGWFETQDTVGYITSDNDPELKNSPAIRQWNMLLNEAAEAFGKPLSIAEGAKMRFEKTGFVDVQDQVFKCAFGTWWANDNRSKELGIYNLTAMIDTIEPYSMALFTRVLEWTRDEVVVLAARIKQELRSSQNHLYAKQHFTFGRKPE